MENNIKLCKPRALLPASQHLAVALSLGSNFLFPRHLETMGALLDYPRD